MSSVLYSDRTRYAAWLFVGQEKPWFPLKDEDYTFISCVSAEERVRALKPPSSRAECEVLLMVGLPGSGKTHWAAQRQKEEPEKRYYVLGTNNIIDKMKVSQHSPRSPSYKSICLTRLWTPCVLFIVAGCVVRR